MSILLTIIFGAVCTLCGVYCGAAAERRRHVRTVEHIIADWVATADRRRAQRGPD